MAAGDQAPRPLPAAVQLPATLLVRYLFFLGRRPISRSNQHYFAARLAGLQSLGPLLAQAGDPALDAAAAELALLTPATFAHRSARLQALLGPLLVREPAPGVAAAASPPGDDFFAPVERATLIFGPAIGVGDEILCCRAARRLRARLPSARLIVLTAYEGLWQRWPRAPAVDLAASYRQHAEMVAAIRGGGPAGRADLVALCDFEKPDLLAAVTREPMVERYVEVSVGGASAAAYDAQGGWLHRFLPPDGGERNHYARLEELLDWLCGAQPAGGGADAGTARSSSIAGTGWPAPGAGRRARRGTLEILVSPFTSKQEPSLVYWSRLLIGLAAPAAAADGDPGADGLAAAQPRVLLRLDPGPNLATARFASALAQAVRAGSGTWADVEVLHAGGRRTSTLADVLSAMESADAVVTSDSFAAHAAPLAGCLTLVVAQPGLQEWRVPSPCSFYFEDALPLAGVAAAMRLLLVAGAPRAVDNGGNGHHPAPWRPPAAGRLLAATRRLAAALATNAAPDAASAPSAAGAVALAAADLAATVPGAAVSGEGWRRTYEEAAAALGILAAAFDEWPRAAAALLADRPYQGLLPPLPPIRPLGPPGSPPRGVPPDPVRTQELRRHGRARLAEWQNSNLHKYLALAAGPAAVDGEER